MEKKKRTLTLIGTILNIIFAVITIIVDINAGISLIDDVRYDFLRGTLVIDIFFAFIVLIFSIILLTKCRRSIAGYKKCSGLAITLFVFNCILVVLAIINMLHLREYILMLVVYAVNGTFILIDVCRNNEAYKNLNNTVNEVNYVNESAPAPTNFAAQSVSTPVNNIATTEKLLKDLTEVKKLLDAGMINEEEYARLKDNIINNAKF